MNGRKLSTRSSQSGVRNQRQFTLTINPGFRYADNFYDKSPARHGLTQGSPPDYRSSITTPRCSSNRLAETERCLPSSTTRIRRRRLFPACGIAAGSPAAKRSCDHRGTACLHPGSGRSDFNACRRRSDSTDSASMLTKGMRSAAAKRGTSNGRTSRPALPATGPRLSRSTCSGRQRHRLVDRLVDRHPHPEPRMPMIKQFSENGPVGVLKRCCTMPNAGTRRSDI